MAAVNSYLQVDGLTASVGDRVLFSDISFGIAERQHVGLIARNGMGKSTLLNILTDQLGPDSGTVTYRRGLKVGYLEQTPHLPMHLSVLDACYWKLNVAAMSPDEAQECRLRARQVLTKLQIGDLNQPLSELSGGQLRRVALANVLIIEPDLLLLDEPTNHLDVQMIEWLEAYLRRSCMTLLMVTHDRYFLDRVCDTILELDDETLYTYRGNYTYYLQKRQERLDALGARRQRLAGLYRTELSWMRRMPQARGHKARYREEAFYELEREARQRVEEKSVRLQVKSSYIGSKIFEAEYVSKSFPQRVILKDFYYCFSRYEKLGLVGPNGSGKSTFVKMLLGLVKPDSGRFVIGDTVRFGYFSQEGMQFNEQQRVIDAVRDIAEYIDLGGGRHLTAMQFLTYFLFEPQVQQNYIYKLSGGERRRLYLCTVLMRNPNFLVLDEPSNDLDIVTLQLLEEYLQDFRGCVIVVSHDRYFIDKVVDHILVFKGDGQVKDFPGNYSQFREWEALPSSASSAAASSASSSKGEKPKRVEKEKKRLTYREQQEFSQLEADIELLEREKRQIENTLSSGTASVADITALSKRLPRLNAELDEKSTRWLELSEFA
ncbi:MAG: ABC-F family ATP-binding cassette domain-containing protein [Prevotellaceae bacterium]|nr:ABC-F family ATP-binding cassette domain-containing protein [Prevotellaceae bacterium]